MDYAVRCIKGKIKNPKQTVCVGGSKSITARAALVAALADGISTLYGISVSDDAKTLFTALQALKIECRVDGTTAVIEGCNGQLPPTYAEINVGNSGTAARFLTTLVAFSEGTFKVNCDVGMKSRPMQPLIRSLEKYGAKFEFWEKPYCLPFTVTGVRKSSAEIDVDVTLSSQYLSAMLLCGVCFKDGLKINYTGNHGMEYVNMTVDTMWSFGVNVEEGDGYYSVCGRYSAKKYDIEPDLSSTSYFYAINKLVGTYVAVNGFMQHSMQSDGAFIRLLESIDGGTVDCSTFSDQALTLAAISPYFNQPTLITGIGHIRGQECDRIQAAVDNLRAMGVKVEYGEDWLKIYPSVPHSAKIKTYNDHRVAMSFALCGLVTEGIVIEDAECCSKSFPAFFTKLSQLIDAFTR